MKKAFDQKAYEDDLKAKEEKRQAELAAVAAAQAQSERVDTSPGKRPLTSGLPTGYVPLSRTNTKSKIFLMNDY